MNAPLALSDLAAWLEGLRWFVFGAQALAVRGIPRQTLDVDVTVALPLDALAERLASLATHRLSSRPADPVAFAERYGVLPLLHASGITIDVILAGTPFETEAMSRATPADILGVRVPVVSAEDLVVYKLGSDRPQDAQDARAVIARNAASLDTAYVRRHLIDLERALDRSDLVAEFDALVLRRAGREPE